MACFHPHQAYQVAPGRRPVFSLPRGEFTYLQLPCGKCIGCKLEYSRQWSVRIMNEASMHEFNSFLTMTYDDDNVPDDFSLNHSHVQAFLKRLRSRLQKDMRYYVAGEYGELTSRPHYHMCLFGEDFTSDRKMYSVNNGNRLYTSDILDSLWQLGSCQIGTLTVQSAAYVSRYVLDKQVKDHYEAVDRATGEVLDRRLPYCRMSLRPAIGKRWIEKYYDEVYLNESDKVYADGKLHQRPPRYYDKVVEDIGLDLTKVKENRVEFSRSNFENGTPKRLAVREKVKQAQINHLRRNGHE